eukprot:TRINITY_DN11715_c1_g1_i1.p1 TRINITY_DN11715_c1_g1~~TRINITY_DN11715_c1_g1_i1.p1  ORF type:complete len:248 (-),score=95.77 TRINITY_DN11715_c1_g1_i1:80-823(-)
MEESRSAQVEKEYMIQHFGTDPSFLIEDICEDFKDHLTSVMTGLKDVIKRKKAGKFEESELDRKMAIQEDKYKCYFEKKCEALDNAMKSKIFQVPRHVLLKEDLPWENLTQSAVKEKNTILLTQMEKQREEYKTALYKRTYLRKYIDQLKQACTYQEEIIQKEASLKEKNGLQDTMETLKFLEKQWEASSENLERLRQVQKQVKRAATTSRSDQPEESGGGFHFPTEKRLKLDHKLKQEENILRTQE